MSLVFIPPILKPSHRSDFEVDVVLVSQLKLAKDPVGKIIEFSHQVFYYLKLYLFNTC